MRRSSRFHAAEKGRLSRIPFLRTWQQPKCPKAFSSSGLFRALVTSTFPHPGLLSSALRLPRGLHSLCRRAPFFLPLHAPSDRPGPLINLPPRSPGIVADVFASKSPSHEKVISWGLSPDRDRACLPRYGSKLQLISRVGALRARLALCWVGRHWNVCVNCWPSRGGLYSNVIGRG